MERDPIPRVAVSARRRRVRAALLLPVLVAVVAACSSGDDDTVAVDDVVDAPPPSTDGEMDDELFTEASDEGNGQVATTLDAGDLGPVPPPIPTDVVSDSVVDPIEPVPDTGVPGIDSGDTFCRSWSRFAGSYQALTFSWAVVGGEDAARLEVIAADALRSAVDSLTVSLPSELESERVALTVELPGPLLRRADLASELLAAEGVDQEGVDLLTDAWLVALTEFGVESEALAVSVDDAGLDAAVDAAATALVGELPPITEDPSLIVDVDISDTETYLFENCPDRGILAGNDNVAG